MNPIKITTLMAAHIEIESQSRANYICIKQVLSIDYGSLFGFWAFGRIFDRMEFGQKYLSEIRIFLRCLPSKDRT